METPVRTPLRLDELKKLCSRSAENELCRQVADPIHEKGLDLHDNTRASARADQGGAEATQLCCGAARSYPPQRTRTWLEPRELAQQSGISTRTLAVWLTDGRFRPIDV